MTVAEFLAKLEGVKKTAAGWEARCPAHDDHHASLSIGITEDGKVLCYCHRGCSVAEITAAVGLSPKDLFPMPQSGGNNRAPIVNVYDYRNADGELVFQVCRRTDKGFTQRQPDGKGGWIWDMKGVERVLYRLPELNLANVRTWVFIPEGEKDADKLAARGLTATCNSGGAGKWRDSYSQALRDRRVAVLSDNDAPGRKHAEQVARSLTGIAADVRVVELPDLPDKGDVSDWLDNGGTPETLCAIIKRAPVYVAKPANDHEPAETAAKPATDEAPGKDETDREPAKDEEPPVVTEFRLAERMAAQHGTELRYCSAVGWFAWDGKRWRRDDTGEVSRRAKLTVRSLLADAAQIEDKKERRRLAEFALRGETRAKVSAIVELAKSEHPIPLRVEELDADPWLLNAENGTLDLRTGTLRPHNPADLITKLAPVEYDPQASCPLFDKFLERILPAPELRTFAQRAFGSAATGAVREHALHLLWGAGSNGKSTLINIILATLGGYGMTAPPKLLMTRRHESHPTQLADLYGKRLVASVESGEGHRLDEELVKQLTGGDRIKGRFMRQDFFEFSPTHQLMLATNHKPEIRGTDLAIWRRVRLWPFTVTIPEGEQDTELPDKLAAERGGIMAWVVRGCLDWQRDGLAEPDEVRAATKEYRGECDILGVFIDDRCVIGPDCKVASCDLYASYEAWAKGAGEQVTTLHRFGKALTERGFTKDRIGPAKRTHYFGIGLFED